MTRARTRRRRAGYTLIEVMMAVGVMMVGSVGIFAMQQASTRGNVEARQMTTANNVARTWAERLRRDQLLWRTSGGGLALAPTDYLENVPAGAAPGGWTTPVPTSAAESFAFDWYGNDTTVAAEAFYCTNVQYRWFIPNQAIRADIRVWWVRHITGDARLMANCTPGNEAAATAEIRPGGSLRAVHLSVLLTWTPRTGGP